MIQAADTAARGSPSSQRANYAFEKSKFGQSGQTMVSRTQPCALTHNLAAQLTHKLSGPFPGSGRRFPRTIRGGGYAERTGCAMAMAMAEPSRAPSRCPLWVGSRL